MITLKTLLDQLQDICRCMVRNDYDTTRFISRIDILRQNTVLCPDTLYLCPDGHAGKSAKTRWLFLHRLKSSHRYF